MKEFAHIKKNIYIDRKKYAFSDDEAYVCSCERHQLKRSESTAIEVPFDAKKEDEAFSCGKSCLNKMVSWECVEHLCPAGVSCRNRRFQQHLYEEVYPVKTESRGWGLCAGEFLPKGTFVMQYIGEIYSIDSQYGQGKLKEYRNKTCTYLMSISKNEVIDPTYKGNLARFINHSCEPNCETQKWHVLGEICVGIFTLRDIKQGEEFTFNYGFDILKTTYQKCLCGARNCKGYLGIVTNNEVSKGLTGSILCDVCKNICKGKETIVVCDGCKKIFHKNCVRRTKERKILESIKNYDPVTNNYLCNHCIKKKDKEAMANSASAILSKKESNSNNFINELNNLSLSSSQILETKDKYRDKKSSQELIVDFKKKKLKKRILPLSDALVSSNLNQNSNSNVVNEECASVAESSEMDIANKEFLDAGLSSIKVDERHANTSNVIYVNDNSSEGESSNKIKTVRTFEEDEIVDVTIEVSEMDIKKIQTSLKTLSNIGARLFWDYRQLSNIDLNNLIEVKITGTQTQIDKVREEINKIIAEKQVTLDSYHVEINVPKLFVRKIIGHQNRHLISYKSKFNVEFEFDHSLITDDIFHIGENSKIKIKGKENFVKFIEKEIKIIISNLKVFTLFLMPTDYNYVRTNICQLKTMVDPSDLRLRKRDYKTDRDIKHSFFYVPSNHKDLVIIGYDNELKKAEKTIKEYLLRQNTLNVNSSLCFLCPLYYSNLLDHFLTDQSTIIHGKNIIMKVFDPVFSRKHLNVYLEGKWKDIIELKEILFKYLSEKDKNKTRGKSNMAEFEQYAFNQEHKLISKNLRKYFLESDYMVKNWDLISEDIWQAIDVTKSESKQKKEKDEYSKLIKEFNRNSDRDTTMNYLLHLPPGSYNSVFSMSKIELSRNLINYVGENLESYQANSKEWGDKKEKSETKTDIKQEIYRDCVKDGEVACEKKKVENYGAITLNNNVNKIMIDHDLIENLSESESEKSLIKQEIPKKIETTGQTSSENLYKSQEMSKKNSQNDIAKINQSSYHTLSQKLQSSDSNNPINQFPLSFTDTSLNPKDNFIQVNNIRNTLSIPEEKNINTIQIDKNKFSLNNQILNPAISAIDNIQSTLLNKLNEIRNENKSNNELTNLNPNNSEKSSDSMKNITTTLPNYGIVMQDDLNILKSLKNTQSTQNTSLNNVINPSEIMNISYNFSNINQMNININISSIKDLMNDQSINPHIKQGGDGHGQTNQFNEINMINRENEKESALSKEDNMKKYDKYSDRNREKDYMFLKRKFKPTQAIEQRNTRNTYYYDSFNRDRNFNSERDRERTTGNQSHEYNYYNKRDNANSSRYPGNRKYYNQNQSANNFSNFNYSKNPRVNYLNSNGNKPYSKPSNFHKRDKDRYSLSKSNSEGILSRSHSRSRSISREDEKSDSYSDRKIKSIFIESKRNTCVNTLPNKENEHSLKTKNDKATLNSSLTSQSQSRSRSNSKLSSSSSSSYSSSTSKSFKREREREYTQSSHSFKNRNRGGMINSNGYKQGYYNRKLHYTNNNYNNQNYRQNFQQTQGVNEYNNGQYYSNPNNKQFYYENNKYFPRSPYYKTNNGQKFNYSNGRYTNNNYNRYNQHIRKSRSVSRSPSKDKYKEFLRLKKKESENLVERENVTDFDISNVLTVSEEVIQLKSCLRKPNIFN